MSATPVAVPPQLGRYRILRLLGQGGMGAVHLAEDTKLGRKVALKVPHADAQQNPEVIARFEREARLAAQIDHPSICAVFDAGEQDGTHYFVMPFIEGTPLSQYIGPDWQWAPPHALALMQRVALAVQVLHDKGLIHRDLKPSNIMLRPSGEPVIMDLGLARSFTSQSKKLTETGSMVGTPAYMSPEQVRGDKTISASTDVYALGAILYELLTGQVPFPADNTLTLIYHIMERPPAAPSSLRPDLDRSLDELCLKAMAKLPQERQASASAFAAALTQPLQPVAPATPAAPPPAIRQNPMAVTSITCSACGATLKVPPGASGRRLRCGKCQTLLQAIPAPASAVAETVAPSSAHDRTVAGANNTHNLRNWLLSVAATVVAAGVLIGGLILLIRSASSTSSEKSFENSIKMKLVWVPPGKFKMGSPTEEDGRYTNEHQHNVKITKGIHMGVYEVTQAQYKAVMGKNPSWFSADGGGKDSVKGMDTDDFPVERVSHDEAVEFCKKLSELPAEKKAGRTYRLPTEAEWEYVCRGGASSSKPFYFAKPQDTLSSTEANFSDTKLSRTTTVGTYKPNAFGLYDMHGNIWEWCADYYDKDYYTTRPDPDKDPTGPTTDTKRRVLRGGCWYYNARSCRAADRNYNEPDYCGYYIGFRVVCVVGAGTP